METFDVWITFPDGSIHKEEHTENTLLSALQRLTRGPAAVAGWIEEVKVVDMLDCTNFLWRNGELIFPTKADLVQ